jgi:hypothetical protein
MLRGLSNMTTKISAEASLAGIAPPSRAGRIGTSLVLDPIC